MALDPVNAKAVKGKFKDREDKDLDNDGDSDASDEYLHKRRSAVSKAIKSVKEAAPKIGVDNVAKIRAQDRANKPAKVKPMSSTQRSLASIRAKSESVKEAKLTPDQMRKALADDKAVAKSKDKVSLKKAPWDMKKEEVKLDEKYDTSVKKKPVSMMTKVEKDKNDERRKSYKEFQKSLRKEETQIDEALAPNVVRGDNYVGVPDRVVALAKEKVKKTNPSTASDHSKAMHKALSEMGWEMTVGGKYVRESNESVSRVAEQSLDEAQISWHHKTQKHHTIKHPDGSHWGVYDHSSYGTKGHEIRKIRDKEGNPLKAADSRRNHSTGYKSGMGSPSDAAKEWTKKHGGTISNHKKTNESVSRVFARMVEAKDNYTVAHKSFSSAVQHAEEIAKKRGFEIDPDVWDRKVAMGPRKPGVGKTNSYNIDLMKNGKDVKQKLHMQVYYDEGRYELNMYIS